MIEVIVDDLAIECAELIGRLRDERAANAKGYVGMHSVGGWHTHRFRLGTGWLGEAMLRRLERAGRRARRGSCWGNILPVGASYGAHTHTSQQQVAVWCLTDSGGALHIATEPDIIVPDRAGQLVVFPGDLRHWVPQVEQERITVAVNLD